MFGKLLDTVEGKIVVILVLALASWAVVIGVICYASKYL